MGVVAVLVSAAAGFAFGAVWYMSLAKPWMDAAGIEMTEDGKPVNGASPLPFVVSGICMLSVAGLMRHVFVMSGVDGPFLSAISGLGVGLFFIAPWMAMNYAYAMRPLKLTLIDGGYAVIGCTVIGLVMGLF